MSVLSTCNNTNNTNKKKLLLNTAIDEFLSKVAKDHNLTLEKAVGAILESPTVASILATKTTVGLIKQQCGGGGDGDSEVSEGPVKSRQLANIHAADEEVGKMSRSAFVTELIAALEKLATYSSLEDAAVAESDEHTSSLMLRWLHDLPANDKMHDVGLEYTAAMTRTMFFRLQEKAQQLLGAALPDPYKSHYEALLVKTRADVTKSVEKRLKTLTTTQNANDDAIETEVNDIMANLRRDLRSPPTQTG